MYRCIVPHYCSNTNKRYVYNDRITKSEYLNLRFGNQKYFEEIRVYNDNSNLDYLDGTQSKPNTDWLSNESTSNDYNWDTNSNDSWNNSSNDSGFDYGGGESGGGGASGSWD